MPIWNNYNHAIVVALCIYTLHAKVEPVLSEKFEVTGSTSFYSAPKKTCEQEVRTYTPPDQWHKTDVYEFFTFFVYLKPGETSKLR